ncbi:MAG: sugar transferase [Collinsella sp.]
MQSIMDWDRSRWAYRAVKRAFDIVFSGSVLAVIAIPSLVLAAAIRLESEGNPFYSQIRVGQTHPRRQADHLPHVEVPLHVQGRRRAPRRAQGAERDRRRHVQDEE